MHQTPEKAFEYFSVTEEQLLASQTLSHCWRLERPHYVLQDLEQMLRQE